MVCAEVLDLLVVEDDEDDFFLVEDLLRTELDANSQRATSVDEALRLICQFHFDVILLDYSLGAANGLDLLAELRRRDIATPVIFLTGHGGEDIAVRALKSGAVDYLPKTKLTASSLGSAVRYALALREKDTAVREAQQALSIREREYRMLFENANDAILIIDPATEIILEANPRAVQLYRCSREELVGHSLLELSTDTARGRAAIDDCLHFGSLSDFETVHLARDGTRLHISASGSAIVYRGKPAVLSAFRDISERKAAEQEIFRLNRALKALSKCSEALLHAGGQERLLAEVCKVVVENGGYRMAWVAQAPQPPHNSIRPLASCGSDGSYIEVLCQRYAQAASSSLLVPTALRTGMSAVCRDTSTDPRSASMRDECRERGYASIIALPLHVDHRIFGALAIYAGEPDAFDAAEVELLRELASNLGYGLETLQVRHQKEAAENDLRASEERLRNLMETANEGIWTIDADDRTTFVNAKMASMLGRPSTEILGHSPFDYFLPTPEIRDRTTRARRERARGQYEATLVSANGSHIVVNLNSSPILDARGEYVGALAMISDITDQKRAEEKLRESEQRYRTLFERNLAGVFRADAAGLLVEGNEAFLHMLGYEHIGELSALKLQSMCAAAGFVEPWCETLSKDGHLVNYEMRLLRKDGSTACLLANLVLLRDPSGKPDFIEGTALDITQRRQLEAQLLQSQKMDAIGQLAGGIAHDFNNLLMVIRSYAELAGDTLEGASIKKELDAILKATERGAALTRQLLTFGRKQIFSPKLLDINTVLENMTKVLPRALGEDVRVELHASPELWQVKADPVQIEQLVLNLAVNARDAMPGGGRLTLETSNLVLDSDYVKMHSGVVPGEYVMLAVGDTGCGIPPEVLPRIFEPFFTTKERGKGTGLGLPTVYGIVQQSGGFVWVYSEPGEGTIFKVYLPRSGTAAGAKTNAPQVSEVPAGGSETVLVVEDEEAVRCATRDYLARHGYRVLEASCGEEALRVSDDHSERIDLVITDAVMPGMSGNVLGQKMIERRPGIHVIYVSGYTEATIGSRGPDSAAVFLQKPFSLSVLARKVREVLDANTEPKCAA